MKILIMLFEPLHEPLVEAFDCPDNPRNNVVTGNLLLVGSPNANSSSALKTN